MQTEQVMCEYEPSYEEVMGENNGGGMRDDKNARGAQNGERFMMIVLFVAKIRCV